MQILVGKLQEKSPLWRSRHRWRFCEHSNKALGSI